MSNLSLTFSYPLLFGFCLATAVIMDFFFFFSSSFFFWSAVIASGKTGADGVLLCMNGALEELD